MPREEQEHRLGVLVPIMRVVHRPPILLLLARVHQWVLQLPDHLILFRRLPLMRVLHKRSQSPDLVRKPFQSPQTLSLLFQIPRVPPILTSLTCQVITTHSSLMEVARPLKRRE